jgi:hypothetical protein
MALLQLTGVGNDEGLVHVRSEDILAVLEGAVKPNKEKGAILVLLRTTTGSVQVHHRHLDQILAYMRDEVR